MPKRIGARVAVVILAAAAFWAYAAPSFSSATVAGSDSIGIRLAEVDAASANDPRARLYILDRIAPGSTLERTVAISNISQMGHSVSVYVSGAKITNGEFIGSDGATPNELSSWVSLSHSALQLSANSETKVTVSIKVPSDASAGERYAVIWAEVSSAAVSGIITVNRVGLRIYLSVGPGGAPESSFVIRSLAGTRDKNGIPAVEALVENTGGRALDLSGDLNLSDGPGGLRAGPFAATLGATLAIGGSDIVRVVLPKELPAGPWRATLELHSGLISDQGEATILFPASGKNPPVDAQHKTFWQNQIVLTLFTASFFLFIASHYFWYVSIKRHKKPKRLQKLSPRKH